jgi:hypothetical protein
LDALIEMKSYGQWWSDSVVEHLLSKGEALSSNPSTNKKEKFVVKFAGQ